MSLNANAPQSFKLFDWRVLAISLISFSVLLRLAFIGIVDLLPEEAYYWAYAQNLDFSYFDHPPMVAWLIRLGTTLLGNTELAVRISSWVCSLVAVTYLFGLAYNLYGKTAACVSAILLAVLPIYFSVEFAMTPDAPLCGIGCHSVLLGASVSRGSLKILDRGRYLPRSGDAVQIHYCPARPGCYCLHLL